MLSQAQARIGFSLDQCRERYGEEVKTEAAWSSPSQTAYGFVAGKLYIYGSSQAKAWANYQPGDLGRSLRENQAKGRKPFVALEPWADQEITPIGPTYPHGHIQLLGLDDAVAERCKIVSRTAVTIGSVSLEGTEGQITKPSGRG